MNIAVTDCRYRNLKRYYVLNPDAKSDRFLPEPSPENWREVQRDDFVSESIDIFLERRERFIK